MTFFWVHVLYTNTWNCQYCAADQLLSEQPERDAFRSFHHSVNHAFSAPLPTIMWARRWSGSVLCRLWFLSVTLCLSMLWQQRPKAIEMALMGGEGGHDFYCDGSCKGLCVPAQKRFIYIPKTSVDGSREGEDWQLTAWISQPPPPPPPTPPGKNKACP